MAGDRSDEDDNNNNNIILPLSVYRLQMSDPTRLCVGRAEHRCRFRSVQEKS